MKFKKNNIESKNISVKKINVRVKSYQGEIFGVMGSRLGFVKSIDLGRVFVIPPEEMDLFFPGDVVDFEIVDSVKDKATVINLVKSDFKRFTGEFYEDQTGSYVIPDVYGLNRKIRIPKSLIKYGEQNGDFVSAEIIEHPFKSKKTRNKSAKASILGVISKSDSPTRESSYCIYKNDLPSRFSSDVLMDLTSIPDDFIKDRVFGRVDLRELPFISIDSPSAFDIDDAIYVERTDSGYKLYVSIADVSEFIPDNTHLNREIFERTSSVYLLGHYIPMLPSELSRLCSLDAGGDVLALTVEMDIGLDGKLNKYQIYESVINKNLKLSYDFVEDVVNGFSTESRDGIVRYNGIEVNSNYLTSIFNLYKLHKDLLSSRDDVFADVEDGGFRLELDGRTKRIQNIVKVENKISKSMVRECMLLTNFAAASFIYKNGCDGKSSIFVVRDGIKGGSLSEFSAIASRVVPDFKVDDLNCIKGFNRVLSYFDKESKEILLTNVKDSLYKSNPNGNYYRGLDHYTHFTSPLRRYADILVHRKVKSIIRGSDYVFDKGFSIEKLNTKTKNIKKTETDVENWLKYYYLNDNFGGVSFKASVVSVSDSKISVRIKENGISGFIIANRSFKERNSAVFNQASHSIVGLNGFKISALSEVNVVVKGFDFINKKIIFRMVWRIYRFLLE